MTLLMSMGLEEDFYFCDALGHCSVIPGKFVVGTLAGFCPPTKKKARATYSHEGTDVDGERDENMVLVNAIQVHGSSSGRASRNHDQEADNDDATQGTGVFPRGGR